MQTVWVIRRGYLAIVLLWLLALGACVDSDDAGQQGVLGGGNIIGSGQPWVFNARLVDDLLCIDLHGGGSCFEVPDGNELLYASGVGGDVAVADPTDGFTCVDGAVSKKVERVSIEFTNEVELDAQMIPGHGWALDFFALCIDSPSDVELLTLFDDQGEVLLRTD